MLSRFLVPNQRIIIGTLFTGFLMVISAQAIASDVLEAIGVGILGGIKGAAEAEADKAKREREVENEKEIIRYRYQLEQEREQRRAQEELQRQQAEKQKAEKARQEKEANSISTGTGFFITTDGYFVTNYHVIKNSKSITLHTTGGEKIQASVVRADTVNDLTILKAEGKFPALPVVSSVTAKRGQSVATIGYPHADVQGLEPKVTEGIISSLSGVADDPRIFQISVPIQSGNSGGPLITREGNVIGVIVSKLSASAMLRETGDVTQNVNYAIKSNYLIELLEAAELKQKLLQIQKKVRRLEEITAVVERATALVVASPKPHQGIVGLSTGITRSPEERRKPEGSDKQTSLRAGQVFRDCPDCPEMVELPAGRSGHAFAMGKYEVTQGQWRAVMGGNHSSFGNCGDDCPVENVSRNDAQDFIRHLNSKTGEQYRLPFEEEWEYACRAEEQHEYCGSNNAGSVAWHGGNSGGMTHPVGQKQPNAFGLYDMSGNVWEWVGDCYNGNCGIRVLRGGSWFYELQFARAANRLLHSLGNRNVDAGFRVARTLP